MPPRSRASPRANHSTLWSHRSSIKPSQKSRVDELSWLDEAMAATLWAACMAAWRTAPPAPRAPAAARRPPSPVASAPVWPRRSGRRGSKRGSGAQRWVAPLIHASLPWPDTSTDAMCQVRSTLASPPFCQGHLLHIRFLGICFARPQRHKHDSLNCLGTRQRPFLLKACMSALGISSGSARRPSAFQRSAPSDEMPRLSWMQASQAPAGVGSMALTPIDHSRRLLPGKAARPWYMNNAQAPKTSQPPI